MDVIALHQAGFTNAVAALGTAFTEEHAALLSRYTKEITLIFDADEAGQKASRRAIDILRPTGLQIRVVTIPDGKDPDEFIRKNGADRFKVLLERSANDVEYRLMMLGRKHTLTTPSGRAAYLGDAASLLASLHSPIERDVYAGKLAQDMGVSKQSIMAQIEQNTARQRRQQKKTQLRQVTRQQERDLRQANPEAAERLRAAGAEEALLGLLILHPDYVKRVREQLSPSQMATSFNRAVYQTLLDRDAEGLLIDLPLLTANMDEHGAAYLTYMVVSRRELEGTPEEALRLAAVLREEHELRAADHPEELSPEQIMHIIQKRRNTEQGGRNG